MTNPDVDDALSDATTVAPGSDADSVLSSDSDSNDSSTSSSHSGIVRSDATTEYPVSDSDSVASSSASSFVSDVVFNHVYPSMRNLTGTRRVPSRLDTISESSEGT